VLNIELIKNVADIYDIKVSQVEKGKGGIFYLDKIEEDMKNGEMIDFPMCNIRDIKQGCIGCQHLKSDGTCSRK
jgi:hypothetical protein